jgi:hypothetical protein
VVGGTATSFLTRCRLLSQPIRSAAFRWSASGAYSWKSGWVVTVAVILLLKPTCRQLGWYLAGRSVSDVVTSYEWSD